MSNYVDEKGRRAKVPINPHTGSNADISDPSTWGSYEQALEFAQRLTHPVIGFVLTQSTGVIAYDFDHCVRDDGSLEPWVVELLALERTYHELSPSGKGLRILTLGYLDKAIVNHEAGVEVYSTLRYVTVTGNQCAGAWDDIGPAPRLLAAVKARVSQYRIDSLKPKTRARATTLLADDASSIFREINEAALRNLSAWVPSLFPDAIESDLGYRISSESLDRDLEEDLSITEVGIKDFGLHDQNDEKEGCRTAIDTVIEYAGLIGIEIDTCSSENHIENENRNNRRNAWKAARWLADCLNIEIFSAAVRSSDPDIVLEALNEKFSVVTDGNRVRVLYFDEQTFSGRKRLVPQFMQFQEFERKFQSKAIFEKVAEEYTDKHGNTKQNIKQSRHRVGKWWLEHEKRREYEGIVLAPNKPKVVDGKLNLWTGWGIEPRKGEWPLIRQLITEILTAGNPEYSQYVLNWIAWSIQHPDRPAEVALVFKGEKGTGKSTLNRLMMLIFGQHAFSVSNYNHLIGNFNSHLRNACFVAVEEAIWSGSKSGDGVLKSLITDSSLLIEGKGRDAVTVANLLHIIICTNESWAVPAGGNERRYFISNVSDCLRGNREFWNDLNLEIDNGGAEAFLYDMLRLDLEGFHPRHVVHTEAEADVQAEGLDGLDSYLKELLERGYLPGSTADEPAFCYNKDLVADIKITVPAFYLTTQKLASYMKAVGVSTSERRGGNGRGCVFPALTSMRSAWEAKYPNTKWDLPELTDWLPSDRQPVDEIRKEVRMLPTAFRQ